jgi:hypothetical protein
MQDDVVAKKIGDGGLEEEEDVVVLEKDIHFTG